MMQKFCMGGKNFAWDAKKMHGMQKRLFHGQKGEKMKIQVNWQCIGPLVDLSISFCRSVGPLAHLSVSSINLREFLNS